MSTPAAASTQVWRELRDAPAAVRTTLTDLVPLDASVRALLERPRRRILVSANGASLHAGLALWHTALSSGSDRPVHWVPAGHLLSGAVELGPDDLIVVISASGELRDLIDAVRQRPSTTRAIVVTANSNSTLGRLADVVLPLHVPSQVAVTHTQAYLAATAACLWLAAVVLGDDVGLDELALVPDAVERSIDAGEHLFTPGAVPEAAANARSAVVHGSGPAWAAAMQGALMLKEVAHLPAEGVESREAATSSFTAMGPDQLLLAVRRDHLADALAIAARGVGVTTLCASDPDVPERLVQLATFAGPLAVALVIADQRGVDPDHPWWYGAYLRTVREAPEEVG